MRKLVIKNIQLYALFFKKKMIISYLIIELMVLSTQLKSVVSAVPTWDNSLKQNSDFNVMKKLKINVICYQLCFHFPMNLHQFNFTLNYDFDIFKCLTCKMLWRNLIIQLNTNDWLLYVLGDIFIEKIAEFLDIWLFLKQNTKK